MQQNQEIQAMNKDYACLTEENKEKVLEITKFLVLTQETIVPAILQTNIEETQKRQYAE